MPASAIGEARRIETEDGFPHVFAINVLAPYIFYCFDRAAERLVYSSSGMHYGAGPHLEDLLWTKRPWRGSEAYAESKLHDVLLAFAGARRWPDVRSNALEPGWVPTRMGGPGAPGDLSKAHLTQAWLATSEDPLALSTGTYFYHQRSREPNPVTRDERIQVGSWRHVPSSLDSRWLLERARKYWL